MRILSQQEVFFALQYAKSIPESEGARILNRFQEEQPALCEMLFGGLPQAIARQDQDMAHLFMDLCFDVLCVYKRTLGDLPLGVADRAWLCSKMAALEKDLIAQHKQPGSQKAGQTGQAVQTALLEYLEMAVQERAGNDPGKHQAGLVTANFLFAITRLLDVLYDEPSGIRH